MGNNVPERLASLAGVMLRAASAQWLPSPRCPVRFGRAAITLVSLTKDLGTGPVSGPDTAGGLGD
ncbi:MAG: hypothetical protein GX443_07910 [Deltaproteobacteria bacterium]|nr:hypothetical protein [Deltaproteobacteria bacterium]